MSTLVIVEHDNVELKSTTLRTITAALQLGGEVHLLVAGQDCNAVAEAAAKVAGVDKVLVGDAEVYAHQLAENLAPLIARLAKNYTHLLAPATTMGKDLMPRVAALLDVAQISDISGIVSQDTFLRPIYAGKLIATVQSSDPIKVITVRSTSFATAETKGEGATIDRLAATQGAGVSRLVRESLTQSERPELTSADIIIAGGRGIGNADNFALLEAVADKLGAAIGASRAAVDAGLVPNDCQIGQTGKVVAPKLYIAVGLSGAIQHLAGIKDSQVIVAINKDEDAPIFQVADYGLVGDLVEVLPQLAEALDNLT